MEASKHILKDNLEIALRVAIDTMSKKEQLEGYTGDSNLVAGWRECLAGLRKYKTLIVK